MAADISLFDLGGAISAKIKFPVYQDEEIVGQKRITENLAYVQGGNSDTAKIVINAFTNLYDVYELDTSNTTVTYSKELTEYISSLDDGENEYSIIAPDDVMWNMSIVSLDSLGTSFKNAFGYFEGSLTPEKAEIFDQMTRALIELSTNTYSAVNLSAVFKPYEGGE